jgi:hypothetical protein
MSFYRRGQLHATNNPRLPQPDPFLNAGVHFDASAGESDSSETNFMNNFRGHTNDLDAHMIWRIRSILSSEFSHAVFSAEEKVWS